MLLEYAAESQAVLSAMGEDIRRGVCEGRALVVEGVHINVAAFAAAIERSAAQGGSGPGEGAGGRMPVIVGITLTMERHSHAQFLGRWVARRPPAAAGPRGEGAAADGDAGWARQGGASNGAGREADGGADVACDALSVALRNARLIDTHLRQASRHRSAHACRRRRQPRALSRRPSPRRGRAQAAGATVIQIQVGLMKNTLDELHDRVLVAMRRAMEDATLQEGCCGGKAAAAATSACVGGDAAGRNSSPRHDVSAGLVRSAASEVA